MHFYSFKLKVRSRAKRCVSCLSAALEKEERKCKLCKKGMGVRTRLLTNVEGLGIVKLL